MFSTNSYTCTLAFTHAQMISSVTNSQAHRLKANGENIPTYHQYQVYLFCSRKAFHRRPDIVSINAVERSTDVARVRCCSCSRLQSSLSSLYCLLMLSLLVWRRCLLLLSLSSESSAQGTQQSLEDVAALVSVSLRRRR